MKRPTQRTLPSSEKIREAYFAVREVETCEAAITQYAEFGISGCDIDLEHRQMREDAFKLARAALKALK